MKTSELTGAALDWAVAKCDKDMLELYYCDDEPLYLEEAPDYHQEWSPSTNWAQGGPIIEREWLDVTPWPNESDEEIRWQCNQHDVPDCCYYGPTPLIAAMRCLVASKMGNEIEIPEGLQ